MRHGKFFLSINTERDEQLTEKQIAQLYQFSQLSMEQFG